MTRIALMFAAASLAIAPAAFAQGKGEAKAQHSTKAHGGPMKAQVKAQGSVKSQGPVKARASVKAKGNTAPVVRRTSDTSGSWTYQGRQYDQFDLPTYRLPPGQAKKIFNRGERMPAAYYAQNRSYVLQNPSQYQLQPPPAGYQWVRVDNDVYLVRSQTGVITDAVRSIFR